MDLPDIGLGLRRITGEWHTFQQDRVLPHRACATIELLRRHQNSPAVSSKFTEFESDWLQHLGNTAVGGVSKRYCWYCWFGRLKTSKKHGVDQDRSRRCHCCSHPLIGIGVSYRASRPADFGAGHFEHCFWFKHCTDNEFLLFSLLRIDSRTWQFTSSYSRIVLLRLRRSETFVQRGGTTSYLLTLLTYLLTYFPNCKKKKKKLYLPSKIAQYKDIRRNTVGGCQRRLTPINAGHPLQLRQ